MLELVENIDNWPTRNWQSILCYLKNLPFLNCLIINCVICAGEGQGYTVGHIGRHAVVSTKLSKIGKGAGATVAAGNTVTRLLGMLLTSTVLFLIYGFYCYIYMLVNNNKCLLLLIYLYSAMKKVMQWCFPKSYCSSIAQHKNSL